MGNFSEARYQLNKPDIIPGIFIYENRKPQGFRAIQGRMWLHSRRNKAAQTIHTIDETSYESIAPSDMTATQLNQFMRDGYEHVKKYKKILDRLQTQGKLQPMLDEVESEQTNNVPTEEPIVNTEALQ